jgi:hypothetical protein
MHQAFVFATAPGWVSYTTAGVAVLAFVLGGWRLWAELPRLTVRQDEIVVGQSGEKRQYIRAQVCNNSYFGTVRGTEVLAHVKPITGRRPGLDIRPLSWVSAESGSACETKLDIPPSVARHIDIVVCEPVRPAGGERHAAIPVARTPRADGHLLPDDEDLSVHLVIACEGRRAAEFVIDLRFDGYDVRVVKPLRKCRAFERQAVRAGKRRLSITSPTRIFGSHAQSG